MAMLQQVIDPIAPRYTALVKSTSIPLHIPEAKEYSQLVAMHPKVLYLFTGMVLCLIMF